METTSDSNVTMIHHSLYFAIMNRDHAYVNYLLNTGLVNVHAYFYGRPILAYVITVADPVLVRLFLWAGTNPDLLNYKEWGSVITENEDILSSFTLTPEGMENYANYLAINEMHDRLSSISGMPITDISILNEQMMSYLNSLSFKKIDRRFFISKTHLQRMVTAAASQSFYHLLNYSLRRLPSISPELAMTVYTEGDLECLSILIRVITEFRNSEKGIFPLLIQLLTRAIGEDDIKKARILLENKVHWNTKHLKCASERMKDILMEYTE